MRSASAQAPPRLTDLEKGRRYALGSLGASTRRKSSLVSYISRWRRGLGELGSRRSRRTGTISYDPVSEWGGEDDLHRHHEKQGSTSKGKGKMGEALLPFLPEVSTFTWSDLRSKNTSAESTDNSTDDDGLDVAQTYSIPTDAATLSHNTSCRTEASQRPQTEPRVGVVGTSVALPPHSQLAAVSTQAPRDPQAKRSLTPPGLSSKASSVRQDSYPDYVHPDVLFADDRNRAYAAEPRPRVSLPQAAAPTSYNILGIEMEPAGPSAHKPHSQTKSHSGSLSRPGSLQLPSPPDSPPPPAGASASSRPHGHGRSASHAHALPIASGSHRPPLGSTRSAPITSALPFRPPTSSAAASTPAWWSTTSAHHPSTLSPPQSPPRSSHRRSPSQTPEAGSSRSPASAGSRATSPQGSLTHAFRTPLQRSPSHSSQHDTASILAPMEGGALGRYPSLTVSPAAIEEDAPARRSRHRSATVGGAERPASSTGERPSRTPQGARPRPGPVEALRQLEANAGSPSNTPGAAHDRHTQEEKERRAHLRASMAPPQTPHVVDKSRLRREKGQSVAALGYFDTAHGAAASPARGPASALASPASAATSRASSPAPVRAHDYAQPGHAPSPLSPLSPASSSLSPSPSASGSSHRRHSVAHQPTLVRRHDSPALRPLPASTLFGPGSPPVSPPLRPHGSGGGPGVRRADAYLGARSRSGSGVALGERSRSGSVASLAVLGERPEREAEGAEGRDRERERRRERRESTASRRSVLPPVERHAPLDMREFEAQR
ncbi:hypothetical protein PsYK624_076080 [Phanerochaete sordida]|uniref:Uncharacterized protein n=1 Tax=Phanerochaete sordida TaxID=48140 RepID=A0A9P3G8S8_9APHY|nr:hypothetical protein PsYK624_076080 [Phanerochaete sordida]